MAEKQLCPTCGRMAVCDEHHPMGRAHAPAFTTPECRTCCHPVLTERLADGGVVLDHDVERGHSETVWAFARGVSDPLALMATHHPALGQEVAEREERFAVALGRFYSLIAEAAGEPGIEGPDPRRNDLRRAGRRGKREDRSVPRRPTLIAGPQVDRERATQLAALVSDGIQQVAELGGLDDWAPQVAQAAQGAETAFDWLEPFEDTEIGDDIIRVIEHGSSMVDAFVELVMAAERLEDLGPARAQLERMGKLGDAALAFQTRLAASETPEDAARAVAVYVGAALAI